MIEKVRHPRSPTHVRTLSSDWVIRFQKRSRGSLAWHSEDPCLNLVQQPQSTYRGQTMHTMKLVVNMSIWCQLLSAREGLMCQDIWSLRINTKIYLLRGTPFRWFLERLLTMNAAATEKPGTRYSLHGLRTARVTPYL